VRVAILGAEGTGKTRLTQELAVLEPDSSFEDLAPSALSISSLKGYDLILLMGTDLPLPQGSSTMETLQKRAHTDLTLRQTLDDNGISYSVIYGTGESRIKQAQVAVAAHRGCDTGSAHDKSDWKWECDRCSDAACEHRLFSRLLKTSSVQA
jgi:nicotinamide riboside kinase